MREIRDALAAMGLPAGDLHALPDSPLRFPDGAHYRIEIPSTEGPDCLRAVLDSAARLDDFRQAGATLLVAGIDGPEFDLSLVERLVRFRDAQ